MSHNSDMIKLVHLLESKQEFAGERVGQKPGDQVRGTDKAEVGGKDHPFKGRLVGEDTTLEDKLAKKYQDFKELQAKEKAEKKKEEIEEVKQRLDPKCWDGYKKQGTKMKGGVRVNNCVPESAEQDVSEGERTMSRAAKGHEKYGKAGMAALAKAGRDGASEKKLDAIRDKHDRYKERVAEGLDPAKKGRLYDLIELYRDATEPNAYYDRDIDDPDEVIAMIRSEFGDKIADQVAAGAEKMHYPRHGIQRSDPLGGNRPVDRITKAGKMYKQDMDFRKRMSKYRMGIDEQGVAEGLPQTLRKVVPGYAKREIDKKMDAGKFGKTDADKDANFQRYKKIQDKLKEQGVAEESESDYDARMRRLAAGYKDMSPEIRARKEKIPGWKDQYVQALDYVKKHPKKDEQGVAEGAEDNPVASAIYRRLMNQKPDLFTRYGLEVVAQAVEDVADSVGHLGPDDEIGSSDVSGWVRQVEQQLRNMGEGVAEATNPTDKITVDVPLMLRIMEYAREDAQDDMDLHDVTEKLVELSAGGKTLSMSDYDAIVGMTAEQKLSELGATPPAGTANPAATATTANAAPTTGSVSPDEQTALNKIQTNPTMKAQLDKLMTQAKPAQTGQPMKLNPDQEDALEKIKANAGLKTQYDKIIQQANPQAKV